jgi:hypothetical protein
MCPHVNEKARNFARRTVLNTNLTDRTDQVEDAIAERLSSQC